MPVRRVHSAAVLMLLALTGCGEESGATGDVGVIAGTWRPVELLGRDYSTFEPVNGDTTITLTTSKGRWSGHDGCNEVDGSLEVDAAGRFRAVAESTTDVGCDLSPRQELPNVPVVEQATRWRVDQDRLVLEAADGTVLGIYHR